MRTMLFGVLLLISIHAWAGILGGTSEVGSGGSIIRLPDGRVVPADLYFKERDYQLPDHYQGPVTDKEFPEMFEKYEELLELIELRTDRKEDLDFEAFDLARFEIYKTEILSGDESFETEIPGTVEPAAFTFHFTQITDGRPRIRRIIEMNPRLLRLLESRHQALLLFHEVLHQNPKGFDHSVISPLVKALDSVWVAWHRQKSGDYSDISKEEFEASATLTSRLYFYGNKSWNPGHDRRGGGTVEDAPEVFVDNFVDMISKVDFFFPEPFPLASISRNLIIRSDFRFTGSGPWVPCEENRFEDVDTFNLVCKSSRSVVKNVWGYGGTLALLGDSIHVDELSLGVKPAEISRGATVLRSSFLHSAWIGEFAVIDRVKGDVIAPANARYSDIDVSSIVGCAQAMGIRTDWGADVECKEPGISVEGLNLYSEGVHIQFRGKGRIFRFDSSKRYRIPTETKRVTVNREEDLDKYLEP